MAQIISKGPSASDLSHQILTHNAPQYTFSFTPFLSTTYRHGLSPARPTCKAYLQGHCPLGSSCPDKHSSASSTSNFNNLVCKHWLRGLCKKGESCEFLHEFNLRKMPECNFFVRNGYCSNGEECLYLHTDPSARLPPCPHYDRGFCPLGPRCSKKHTPKQICEFYLAGFCPDGSKNCKKAHPRWPTNLEAPSLKIEKTAEEKEEEARELRERMEADEEREREKWREMNGTTGGGGGRGGKWEYRGRGRGQRGRGRY
ncbi:zinc finger ccch type domain containing protein [Phlyctema vagabunda]|uniref:mRNA 3'-end-processing protein n=1 Tax=Phlyctema vagabunda TaxID=108571 RepID=A0ABR4PPR2_9HELO